MEVADIFRHYGPAYRQTHGRRMPLRHLKAMHAIEVCRTSYLGGHVDQCDHCGHLRISYNSCRNRHCPKCQCMAKESWIEARSRELLPVDYFHVVFTVPGELRPFALRNQRLFYNLLFKSASETLLELSRDPKYLGAQIGCIAVLHTWSQTLMDHPHIHFIIPAGGLSCGGNRWVRCRKGFFIPVRVLSAKFRGKLLSYIRKAYTAGEFDFAGQTKKLGAKKEFDRLLSGLYAAKWVVYCKSTLKKQESVMKYLGRYTYRVAISNERIMSAKEGKVVFSCKDRRSKGAKKQVGLDAAEFIRRFLMHVLPGGFMKIRHYGILSNRNKKTKLVKCQELLESAVIFSGSHKKECWQELLERLTGVNPLQCPECGKGRMYLWKVVPVEVSRAPPPTGLMPKT